MGFFKKNSKPVTANSVVAEKLEAIERKILWSRTVEDKEVSDIATNLITQLKTLTSFRYEAHKKKSILVMTTCLQKLGEVDRLAMERLDALNFYTDLRETLPKLVSTLRTECLVDGEAAWAAETFDEAVIELMNTRVDTYPQLLSKGRRIKAVDATNAEARVTLGNELADSRLVEVNELIAQADAQAETLEDRFTVEQTVASYLPDAVRLYLGLMKAPKDVQGEATSLFIRQLDLIAVQLEAVINRGATVNLGAMKAHLNFLESKQEQAQDSQLRLDK